MPDASEQSSSNHFRETLLQHYPDGVLALFDADLCYRAIGPDILPFSETPASDLLGQTIYELFPEPTADQLEPELKATIKGDRRSFDIEYGDRVHHIETQPVRIDDEPYGVLATHDVTDVRGTATALNKENERLDQFASMLSHDLQTPITIASGHLELYRETGDPSHLQTVEQTLGRIDELTQDLLTLVQAPANEKPTTDCAIGTVATAAWALIETRDASLEVTDLRVTADTGQLQALFENLFRNAIGHGGDDVTIRIGPLPNGFYVEDTGTGIPENIRESVFEHGYSTGYGGNGVGLTIVSRIADHHGWTIELTEEASGGARFEFTTTSEQPV